MNKNFRKYRPYDRENASALRGYEIAKIKNNVNNEAERQEFWHLLPWILLLLFVIAFIIFAPHLNDFLFLSFMMLPEKKQSRKPNKVKIIFALFLLALLTAFATIAWVTILVRFFS